MERCWIFLLFFISGWLFNSTALGSTPVACAAYFKDDKSQHLLINEATKIKNPETIYSIKFDNDTRFSSKEVSPESLVELFQMLGHTQFHNAGEKFTLEKGSLVLARKIDSLLTTQAEYTYDKPQKTMYLTKLSVINSQNGQEMVLSKEPLDYLGRSFAKADYNLVFEKGAANGKVVNSSDLTYVQTVPEVLPEGQKLFSIDKPQITSIQVAFPSAISGEAFQKVLKWSLVVDHLDHSEISIVDSVNKRHWAVAKGNFRRFVEFAKDRFFKQAFGLLVVYMVFDGMSGFAQDVAKYAVEMVQAQGSVVSVKVKETRLDGNITNRQEKFKFDFSKKNKINGDANPQD